MFLRCGKVDVMGCFFCLSDVKEDSNGFSARSLEALNGKKEKNNSKLHIFNNFYKIRVL